VDELQVSSQSKRQVIDLTEKLSAYIDRQPWHDGALALCLLHTTCALTTADLDPGTDEDLLQFLKSITPDLNWTHPHNPAHAPAHLLSSIVGPSLVLPVRAGRLQLGTWQKIVLIEFDGPKDRQLLLTWIPAAN
jgi:secondary thiamine-phosphate synthase enzyme